LTIDPTASSDMIDFPGTVNPLSRRWEERFVKRDA
jgi:hypothetical protein